MREYEKGLIAAAAARYGIDAKVAHYQIEAESNFNPLAEGPSTRYGTAKGLAQFIDSTWADWGHGSPFDPVAAADAYGRFFRWLLDRYNGDYAKALSGYNFGPGNTDKKIAQYGEDWRAHLPTETRNYLDRILSRANAAGGGDTQAPGDFFDEWGTMPGDTAKLALIVAAIIGVVIVLRG